jgi:hypothetical protein
VLAPADEFRPFDPVISGIGAMRASVIGCQDALMPFDCSATFIRRSPNLKKLNATFK